jgi:dTDP-4-dehydrorhamnose 3,5-epimerase
MELIETGLPGLFILKPKLFEDERGYFFESYNKKVFAEIGVNFEFVQDNQSLSKFGVLRGLHYQLEPFAQTKLVRVLYGRVWDVAVDLRKGSPSFGKYYGIELNDENKLSFLIPRGFAHGFVVLSDYAIFFYKCDNYYSKESDRGIRFDDPEINIVWPIQKENLILSQKDRNLPFLRNAEINFVFKG